MKTRLDTWYSLKDHRQIDQNTHLKSNNKLNPLTCRSFEPINASMIRLNQDTPNLLLWIVDQFCVDLLLLSNKLRNYEKCFPTLLEENIRLVYIAVEGLEMQKVSFS